MKHILKRCIKHTNAKYMLHILSMNIVYLCQYDFKIKLNIKATVLNQKKSSSIYIFILDFLLLEYVN